MTMQAIVLRVEENSLLVFDRETRRRVRVIARRPRRFRRGNLVCIRYSGAMTRSIPPQISADSVTALPWFGPWSGLCR